MADAATDRTAGAFPGPLGHFMAQLNDVDAGDVPEMEKVGRLLVELAADGEFFGPLIAEMPADHAGGKWLVKPSRAHRV